MAEDLDLNVDGQGTEDQSTADEAYGAPDLLSDQGAEPSEDATGVQSDEEDNADPFDPFDEAQTALLYQNPERGIEALKDRWQKAELGRKKVFTKRMQRLAGKQGEFEEKWKQVEGAFGRVKDKNPNIYNAFIAEMTGAEVPAQGGDEFDKISTKTDLHHWLKGQFDSLKSELVSQYQGDKIVQSVDKFLGRNNSFKQHRQEMVELMRNTGLSPMNAAAAVNPQLIVKLARDTTRAQEPSGDVGVNESTAPRKVRYSSLEEAFEAAAASPRPRTD